MSDVYIRIDARVDARYAKRFLQRMRDLEQEDPDGIHVVAIIRKDDASLQESISVLRKLSPGLQFERILPQKEMTTEQRDALDVLRQTGEKEC